MTAYKLVFFVPASHKEEVKEALFAEGAGGQGLYRRCCWEVQGWGQFEPQSGSRPFVGREGKLHREEEFRVEMLVPGEALEKVIETLRGRHPYEEPAWEVFEVHRAGG